MSHLKINHQYVNIAQQEYDAYLQKSLGALQSLHNKTGKGNDFIGWVEYIKELDDALVADVLAEAKKIQETSNVLLVIGIGGSYLGTKSALEALLPPFDNESKLKNKNGLRVYFIGHQMSANYIEALLNHIKDDECFVNVISKSGTTTEPAVAFRLVKAFMQKKYGDAYCDRIIATTDKARGALKTFADQKQIKSYVIPDDVGGRYSVFTPVGLLPIAASGVDVKSLIEGALKAYEDTRAEDLAANPALHYAALRNYLYDNGYKTEILVNYDPALNYLSEWWKQLYGESEGKEGKGILPHAMSFTTDLHSLGQYVQEGERTLFETVIDVKHVDSQLTVDLDDENLDGLNYLAGKTISDINSTAMLATILAHTEGGVPNIVLEMDKLDAFHLGYCYYFFMKACAVSGYMLGVNPFDQPGVEAYKKNMFGLLGKPGYEASGAELNKKIVK